MSQLYVGGSAAHALQITVSVFACEVHTVPIEDSLAFVADLRALEPPNFTCVADLNPFTSQQSPTHSSTQGSFGTQRFRASFAELYTSHRAAGENEMRVHFIVQRSALVDVELLGEDRQASQLVLAAFACEHWPYLLPDIQLVANCL